MIDNCGFNNYKEFTIWTCLLTGYNTDTSKFPIM